MRIKRAIESASSDAPSNDAIILSIKLASGGFESSMRIALPATQTEFDEKVTSWFRMIQTGFDIGAQEMTARFPQKKEVADG